MPIVTMNEVLAKAEKGGYAVGMFNVHSLETVMAVVDAAEKENAPVMLGLADAHFLDDRSRFLTAALMVEAATHAKVPVVVHYDHGEGFETSAKLLKMGFSSIMFDGSLLSYEDNITETKAVVRLCNAVGASSEAELGRVGGTEGGGVGESIYTDPGQAKDYVNRTGVDSLAVAIGTAHGEYASTPKLDIKRLKKIAGEVDVPLVLHGGSGLSDDDFKNCIAGGIRKINVYFDIGIAGIEAMKKHIAAKGDKARLANGLYDVRTAVAKATAVKIRLFGSKGKAKAR